MKFKENQDVFILYLKKVRKAKILYVDSLRGVYIIDRIEDLPFTEMELKRGSEAMFTTEDEAQEYLDKNKGLY